MSTRSYKNKRTIRMRSISGNRSEDSLLDSDSDASHPILFTRRCINIIDSDDEFSGKSSSDEENSEPRKIVWQSVSHAKDSFRCPWKGDYLEDPEALYSPVSYFRKLFDDEITSNIVDYANTCPLQCNPTKLMSQLMQQNSLVITFSRRLMEFRT
ncbi:hypothetical protein K0M31_017280 [Melipona bicolor]|uniref:Uncharacterized protein n=1 Tax=Melipona bicolor TaxID=60889 RepID=A0AA40G4L5_9HYME|nr:hypothetical protein K0M31_017280 [Melipona bicolor]